MRTQDVAKQLPVEVVVLDNHDSLCHLARELPCMAGNTTAERRMTIPYRPSSPVELRQAPDALALAALALILEDGERARSEEHTSELQSLMRISYAVFCLKKKKNLKSL